MKSVVLCGSKRFKPEMIAFGERLRELGCVVYEPHLTNFDWPNLPSDTKPYIAMGLTYDHFQKIRLADVVYVYNKDGYVGNSVTLEMGFAAGCNKPIYAYVNEDGEECRRILIRESITTPEELVKKLQ